MSPAVQASMEDGAQAMLVKLLGEANGELESAKEDFAHWKSPDTSRNLIGWKAVVEWLESKLEELEVESL